MAYDPQRERRRSTPAADNPAPVDAILARSGDATTELPVADAAGALTDDPPPDPAVTPAPADPPSDRLLLNAGLVGAATGVALLLVVRHLWLRRRRRAESFET